MPNDITPSTLYDYLGNISAYGLHDSRPLFDNGLDDLQKQPRKHMVRFMQYRIHTRTFSTKKAALAYCSALLKNGISEDDFPFLHDLLLRHPNAELKIGPGVESFYIGSCEYGDCFWLRRVDGTKTDWSFRQCFQPLKPETKTSQAFRQVVRPQILQFKDDLEWPRRCALTDVLIERDAAHADHIVPFRVLLDNFLTDLGLTLADLPTVEQDDGETSRTLQNTDVARQWYEYHAKHARLQAVSVHANLSRGAK